MCMEWSHFDIGIKETKQLCTVLYTVAINKILTSKHNKFAASLNNLPPCDKLLYPEAC